MKNLMFTLIVLAMLLFGVNVSSIFAQTVVKFGANLDRPVSTSDTNTNDEDDNEEDEDEDEEEDPDDDDEEEPPEFMDEPLEGHLFVLVLDRSCSMTIGFNAGFPVYNSGGNVIGSPNRWQACQSEAAACIDAMTEDDDFDIVTYATSIYICFGSLTTADSGAKSNARGWIYGQNPTG